MVLTFLYATSHAKAFTSYGTLDFQMKFVEIKGIELIKVEIALKEQTKNDPKDVKDQTLMSRKVDDK